MDRELIKQVIADQREYELPKNFFKRLKTEVIREFIEDSSILIMSGLRRSGKSTILRVLQQEMHESDYYLNFDDDRLVQFQVEDFQLLLEIFIELFGKQNTFFFDEIQNIEGWERFIRRLYEKGYKIFITGSNANLLSQELGTRLTGRYIQFEVYPLSFPEIIEHERRDLLTKKAFSTEDVGTALNLFATYFKYGGIPDYYKFRKPEYLKDLYEGILYRDIVARYKTCYFPRGLPRGEILGSLSPKTRPSRRENFRNTPLLAAGIGNFRPVSVLLEEKKGLDSKFIAASLPKFKNEFQQSYEDFNEALKGIKEYSEEGGAVSQRVGS